MSGGVGPTVGDIKLPNEEQETEMKSLNSTNTKTQSLQQQQQQQRSTRLLSFRQLNSLALVVVLSASGMVSIEDFSFVLFSVVYIFFLSKVAFPTLPTLDNTPIFKKNRVLGTYVTVGALIGLFLPICYMFHGIFEGDKQGIKAAAPHVFLLASQVFMEGLTFTNERFSMPIRAFVPVVYNAKRIVTIGDWLSAEIGKVDVEDSGSELRLYAGRGLAVANMAFWCFNLFGFLLPVYLPRCFKRYYGGAAANKLK